MYIQAPTLAAAAPTRYMVWLRSFCSHSVKLKACGYVQESGENMRYVITLPRVAEMRNYKNIVALKSSKP